MFSFTPPADPANIPDSEHLVYFLDDDPRICRRMTRLLATIGFSAQGFSNLTEFELALARKVPQTIILNLISDNSGADETIRSLSAKQVGAAILLLSDNAPTEAIDHVRQMGERNGLAMLPFLEKSFSLEELKSRLATSISMCSHEPDGITLASGLRKNLLELWYQPKIDLRSNTVSGAEALVRLRNKRGLVYTPNRFLPPSNDPLHTALADFVIRRALADWLDFAANRLPIKIAVNIPLSVFENSDFVDTIRKYIPANPQFPGLIIELTENDIVRDLEFAQDIATKLKRNNIQLAIDDFGSGNFAVQRLKELPIAELKIDRRFVTGCYKDPQKHELCRRYVTMAHELNMDAVAQGVETTDDLAALVEMNCDIAQGYYFSVALDPEDLKSALLSNRPITAPANMRPAPNNVHPAPANIRPPPLRQHAGHAFDQ